MPGFHVPEAPEPCSPGGFNPDRAAADFQSASPWMETLRNYRFHVEVAGNSAPFGSGVELFTNYAQTVQRPIAEFDKIEYHRWQNTISMPGKHKYLPISWTFYEIAYFGNTAAKGIGLAAKYFYNWRFAGRVGTPGIGLIDINSLQMMPTTQSKRNLNVYMTDGKGDTLWAYKIFQAWPTKVEWSELDSSSPEISRVTINLVYDGFVEWEGPISGTF